MSTSTRIKAFLETAKTVTHTGAGANFSAVGTPLTQPAQCIIFTSTFVDGSGDAISACISTDNTNNKILIPGNTVITLDVASNKQGTNQLAFPKVSQFYLKQGPDGTPISGEFSIMAIYEE